MSPGTRDSTQSVLIIGAGFGGIAAAIELQGHGYRDVTILEGAPEIGGTWFHNTYPGAACDVPSFLYQYSFARRADWSRNCPPQAEILGYLRETATSFGIDALVQTDSAVKACVWSADDQQWTATTTDGRLFTADVLVIATGQLHQPQFPSLPGIETFDGDAFHSARWRHDVDLRGKRVAVIGNGASAVQFLPEIAKEAGHVTLFQRTGNYFLPRQNRAYSRIKRAVLRRSPAVNRVRRTVFRGVLEALTSTIRHPRLLGPWLSAYSQAYMRWTLRGDEKLQRKIWPDYTFGCKRVLFSSSWLPTLRRPNVEVVTDHLTAVEPTGVRTADGTLHEADVLIYATGFRTTDFMLPMQIHGTGGRRLQDTWADGAHAHLGITVPGFPSMFLMYGPNTNTSGGSIIVFLEAQAAYVRKALDLVRARGAGSIDVRPEVEAASDHALQAGFAGTAWLTCQSWYRTGTGRIVANWPGYMHEFVRATAEVDPAEFVFEPAAAPALRETALPTVPRTARSA